MSTFDYWGRPLPYYFASLYNLPFLNERCVELAVAKDWFRGVKGRGLEVGNVCAHYDLAPARRIVDQYEKAAFHQRPGSVENIDLFMVGSTFDWIVSISTIEHVGEREPNARTAVDALDHLRGLLNPGGRMLVTFGTGYNSDLDGMVVDGSSGATRECTLVKTDHDAGVWEQSERPEVLPYGLGPDMVAGCNQWAWSVWLGEFEA